MQWLQDPNQSNVDNLNYVRREARRHFRSQRSHIWMIKLINRTLTLRSKVSEVCTGESMSLS